MESSAQSSLDLIIIHNNRKINRSACMLVWVWVEPVVWLSSWCLRDAPQFPVCLSSLYFQSLLWQHPAFSRDVFKFNYWHVSFFWVTYWRTAPSIHKPSTVSTAGSRFWCRQPWEKIWLWEKIPRLPLHGMYFSVHPLTAPTCKLNPFFFLEEGLSVAGWL